MFHTFLVGVGKDGRPVWFGPGWGWTSYATAINEGVVAFTCSDLSPVLGKRLYAWITTKGTDHEVWYT